MKIGGEIIGILQVQSYKYNAYSKEDIELLSALANVAAVAIQNARLFSNQYQMTTDLLDQKNKSQLYLDIVDAIIVVLDNDANVKMINKRGCELLKYDENEILEKHWIENFVPEKHRFRVRNLFNEMISGKREPISSYRDYISTNGGMEKIIQWKSVILRDNFQQINGILFSGLDITEERSTQKELQISEEKYNRLLDNINDGLIILENKKIIYLNERACEIYGYSKNDMMENFQEIITNADTNGELQRILNLDLTSSELPPEFELWIKTPKDIRKFINHRISYIFNDNGEIFNQFILISDKTDEKITKDSLLSSEENYRSTLNSMGVPIHVINMDYRIILANQILLDWISNLGLATDIVGKTIFEVFPFLPESVKEEYLETIQTQKPVSSTDENIVENFGVMTETRKIPIIENGEVVRIVTVIRDITDQVKTEKLLKESEIKQRLLYDNLSDSIVVYDKQWNIIDVNKKAIQDFGFTKEEFLNKKIISLVSPEQKELFEEQNKMVLESQISEFNLRLIDSSGDSIPVSIKTNVVEINGEEIIQAIIRDVSEELKIDEERIKHLQELMFLSKTAFDFIAQKPEEDIYDYIAQQFKDQIGESIVVVTSYNNDNNEFTIKSISGLLVPKFGNIINLNPIGLKIPSNDLVIDYLKMNRIGKLPITLQEISNNYINNHQEEVLRRVYNVTDIYNISFVHRENLFGTVIVLLRKNNQLRNIELLEAFASQSAVALLRKNIEEDLQESEERYRKLFNDSYDGIILYNKKLEIIDLNQKAIEFLGYNKNDILKLKIIDSIPPEQHEQFLLENDIIFRDGFAKFDLVIQNKNNRLISVDIVANLIEIGHQNVVQIIFRDITQQKIADEIKTRHMDTLRFISEAAMGFVGLPPEEDIYHYIGERISELAGNSIVVVSSYEESNSKFKAKAILGISKHLQNISKILGKNPFDELFTIDDKYIKMQFFGKLVKLDTDISGLTEGMISKKQGNILWKLLSLGEMYSIAFVNEGKLTGTVLIAMKKDKQIRNIELIEAFGNQASVAIMRKQAEEELRRSEQRFKDLIDTMNDGFGLDDKNGILIYVNEKFCEMLGYEQYELIGQPAISFMDDKNKEFYKKQNESRKDGEQNSYEIIWKKKNGEVIPTIVSPRAYIDENGNYQGSYAVITDITERKKFEEMLLQQQNELQKQRDELESFASTIAHDLRGKMQVISLYNSLMKGEYSDKISENINEMSAFIEDLLFLAKKGEILGEKSVFSLNKMLKNLISKINSLDPELKITIQDMPKIYGDPIKLGQVFENILMNVVKHAEASSVDISYQEGEEYFEIFFQDDGKGIPNKKKQEIEDSWFTKRYSSFGMLIIQKILDAHYGTFTINSIEGKGTKISVKLPKK
ncbi:MAG: PAS domain S-box protein [Candidatus Thorarchaeota archaeon]